MAKPSRKILGSPEWPRIKEAIDANLGKISNLALYRICLGIDQNIGKYENFNHFLNKLIKEKKKRQELAIAEVQDPNQNNREILADITDEAIDNAILLEKSIKVALQLGDLIMAKTLEEAEKIVAKGKPIPWDKRKEIMKWWTAAGSAVFQGEVLKLKKAEGARDTMALGLLCRAARSGNLPKSDLMPASQQDELVEGEIIKEIAELKDSTQINEPQTTNQAQQSTI